MSADTQVVAAPADIVKSLRSFVAAHGGSAKAVLQPVARGAVRITVVAEDGVLGDRVVRDLATAHAVVEALPGVTVSEWDREVTSIATPQQGHWKKMAGWVARQTRFPRARNER
ncbi:hypothetical protein D092_11065 [Rhodococcus ruber Chol-4]|uniref:Uncharacterized protein n=1 Tax=Rhodococcus ruber TaxID=1830 RepID=A0A098BJI9_9NOCA|nr:MULTISPECIES: hypothetical protein [Rhodococcus]RIK13795.1 MAG: hypothetical protein DCC47_02375 [Acidobacteriota bacterium]ATQ27809.1 hypothetical protein CS378_03040 [Rhodococcus ruber]AUM15221.1 hypothetical protein CSW53_00940 [Rhodococcus ruber]AWG99183.1 hypothetical protein DCN13_11715 [Rhodococcus ruber]KXF86649.1 hypothetical protein D092_11065 [Rhodococcus ruber Chol-4]